MTNPAIRAALRKSDDVVGDELIRQYGNSRWETAKEIVEELDGARVAAAAIAAFLYHVADVHAGRYSAMEPREFLKSLAAAVKEAAQ